jgi:hypothetical protein
MPVIAGCVQVSSAQRGSEDATGEAWYTNTTYFIGIPVATDIYYCSEKRPTICRRASIRDAD